MDIRNSPSYAPANTSKSGNRVKMVELVSWVTKEKNDFVENLDNSQTLQDLDYTFFKLCESYSFDRFALATIPDQWVDHQQVEVLSTYPDLWIRRYIEQNYHLHDPVLDCPRYRSYVYTTWDLESLRKLASTPIQKQFLSEAHDFDIKSGLTISLLPDNTERGFLTILGINSLPSGDKMILSTAAEVYTRRKKILKKQNRLNLLTDIERDILDLKAKRVKVKDIIAPLNLSPFKLYAHQNRICCKLKTNSLEETLRILGMKSYLDILLRW